MLRDSSIAYSGLTANEVTQLRIQYGYNEISSKGERSFFSRLLGVLLEPMIFLLISIGFLYYFIGDAMEAVMLSCSVVLIVMITLYQEGKTENALSALKNLASPRTNVIRDGVMRKVDGREIVPGDIIFLSEGDRVPADSEVLETDHLMMDESLLTGESVPILKTISKEIFCGSLVVAGQAFCSVGQIGNQTQIGKIGQKIANEKQSKTLLEMEVARLVKGIFIFAIIVCCLLTIYLGLTTNDWTRGILAGLTLAIGILPEELPLVLTIFFAFGAYRLSKRSVLARKTSIIETLGAASVLCTDKTGTITQNKMTIKCLVGTNSEVFDVSNTLSNPMSEGIIELLKYGILASKSNAIDPMDKCFYEMVKEFKIQIDTIKSPLVIAKEFPISHQLLALTQVWNLPGENETKYLVATKGAPEAVITLCRLSKNDADDILAQVTSLAKRGLRMLAVARSKEFVENIPDSPNEIEFEWLGLVGLEDPIRSEVPAAVRLAYQAGIRIIMITGDYPETAKNIATQIGLQNHNKVMTGNELNVLSDSEYRNAVLNCNIFARVSPDDKWRLVGVLKKEGEIVAMTGDGVNDAPALKTAHIGVAMGMRGTDVAREAAEIVLLDDSFSSILNAVEEGRHIYVNLKKALGYIIAVHIPIIGAAFFPTLFHLPNVILSAIHIVFLEMIIDPTSTLVFEKEPIELSTMASPPRDISRPLLDKNLFIVSLLQGLMSLTAVISTYYYVTLFEMTVSSNPLIPTTASFVTLIFSNLLIILVNRNWSLTIFESIKVKNSALPYVMGGTLLFLFSAIYIPFLQSVFHFTSLSLRLVGACLIISILSIIWFEFGKLYIRNRS